MKSLSQRPSNDNISLGKLGEQLAASYLQKKGYKILEFNFKKRYGELDVICLHGNTLVFVEVKTRRTEEFGLPEEAVTPRKLAEVKQTGIFYASLHPELPQNLRIDVIGIQLDEMDKVIYFNHIQSVTS
jgi:putative endonuclease